MARSFLVLISSISASSAFDFGRARHRADARARTGFVHQVNGLCPAETVGDVTVGKFDRSFDGFVGELRLCDALRISGAGLSKSKWLPRRKGASTLTDWKRRSSAASFSMYLRYSLSVVAPMHCISPRLRAGLMMFEASIVPSAEPAPTMVCNSSMNRMMFLARRIFVHDRLDALLELAAIFGAGDHEREVERDDALVAQQFPGRCPWRFPARDLRRWRFCPRRLRRAARDCSWCGGKESE